MSLPVPTFTEANSECFVYVYREGLLSAVGHDLKLRVTNFTIDIVDHPLAVRGKFRADSLRVAGAMKNGSLHEEEPPAHDKQQIATTILRDVLVAHLYPDITFHSTGVTQEDDTYQVNGWLELHGVRKEIQFGINPRPGHMVARVTVHQPDYGIVPYRAFFGALKVKPDVHIEIAVPFTNGAERLGSA
jgi:hypothetical protein